MPCKAPNRKFLYTDLLMCRSKWMAPAIDLGKQLGHLTLKSHPTVSSYHFPTDITLDEKTINYRNISISLILLKLEHKCQSCPTCYKNKKNLSSVMFSGNLIPVSIMKYQATSTVLSSHEKPDCW